MASAHCDAHAMKVERTIQRCFDFDWAAQSVLSAQCSRCDEDGVNDMCFSLSPLYHQQNECLDLDGNDDTPISDALRKNGELFQRQILPFRK